MSTVLRPLSLGALLALTLPSLAPAASLPRPPDLEHVGARLLWHQPALHMGWRGQVLECSEDGLHRAVAPEAGVLAELYACDRMVLRDLRDGSIRADRKLRGYNGHGDLSLRYAPELGGWLTTTLLRDRDRRIPRQEEFFLLFELRDLKTLRVRRRWRAPRAALQGPRLAAPPARLGPRDVVVPQGFSAFLKTWGPTLWRLGGPGDPRARLLWRWRRTEVVVAGDGGRLRWVETWRPGEELYGYPASVREGAATTPIEHQRELLLAASAAPGEEAIVTMTTGGIHVFSTRDGHVRSSRRGSVNWEAGVAVSPSSSLVVSGSVEGEGPIVDQRIPVWDWRRDAVVAQLPLHPTKAPPGRNLGAYPAAQALAVPGTSPPVFVLHSYDGRVTAWEIHGTGPVPTPSATPVPTLAPDPIPEPPPKAQPEVAPAPTPPSTPPAPEPPTVTVTLEERPPPPPPPPAPGPPPPNERPEGWLR